MEIKEFENKTIHEKLYFSQSKNGLKVYFIPKKGYIKKQAVFTTKYGSIDNKFIPLGENQILEVPEGIAHFLEHKLFEEPEESIFDIFSKRGANVNAFTNFNQTSYLFDCSDYFYENLTSLINFVQNPHLTDENVEKEKGIISQEINMYKDNPGWRVYFNLLNAMYLNHPVKIDIAGTVDSINTINKELLLKAYNTFYHPTNMVLFIVGDLDFKEIMKTINKSEKEYKDQPIEINRFLEIEPKEINKYVVKESMVTSAPILFMGFKDQDIGYRGAEKVKQDIITNIAIDMILGSSSNFYNELYKEGLIDSGFGGYYTSKFTYGHSIISGETNNPEQVHERLLKLISQPEDKLLNQVNFNRIKKNEIGNFLMGFNSMNFISTSFTELYLDDFMILDYLELLDSIKFEEIVDRYKSHFRQENLAISILNPK